MKDYYLLDQSASQLHRSRNKILKEHCNNVAVREEIRCSPRLLALLRSETTTQWNSLSRLLGHYDTQMTAKYLRGLEQESILEIGRLHSPLNDTNI